MTLRDMMARHARITLTRLSHYGEQVTFTPAGGTSRTVRVVVTRLDVEALSPDVQRVARKTANVFVPRDATVGTLTIAPGDTFTMAMRLGEATQVVRVRRIISQDEGGFEVEVAA